MSRFLFFHSSHLTPCLLSPCGYLAHCLLRQIVFGLCRQSASGAVLFGLHPEQTTISCLPAASTLSVPSFSSSCYLLLLCPSCAPFYSSRSIHHAAHTCQGYRDALHATSALLYAMQAVAPHGQARQNGRQWDDGAKAQAHCPCTRRLCADNLIPYW